MSLGLFKAGDTVRIPYQLIRDGRSIEPFATPIVSKMVLPDGTIASGFPKGMTKIEDGIYYLDYQTSTTLRGTYIATIDIFVTDNTADLRRIIEDFHTDDLVDEAFDFNSAFQGNPYSEPR